MARFERGNEFVEVWVADGERRRDPATGNVAHTWPELMSRRGRFGETPAPATVARRYEWSARDDYLRFQRMQLRQGWRRVRDPEREPEVGEPTDPALDAALRADPGDAAAALVYADWLQHRGHPRGALIAVQHARLEQPDDAALADEERRLLDEHADVLLGALRGHLSEPDAHRSDAGLELVWERGFVRRAKLRGYHQSGASEDLVWELLRHPSARFLRELEIGCHHSGDQDNELVSDLLLHAGPTPPLRALVLADFDDSEIDNIDISRAPIGDLTGLGERYPMLESVVLKGTGDVLLGDLALPRARRFALRTSTLARATLAAIVAAPWPALEELELWFGDPDRGYGAECELENVLPLFARPLPVLRRLALRNAMFSDELVPHLLAWPGAAELVELDFALGTLSSSGAEALIAGRARLPKLARLGVANCSLSPGALAHLREVFPVDDGPIAPADRMRAPRQKTARYVSVSE